MSRKTISFILIFVSLLLVTACSMSSNPIEASEEKATSSISSTNDTPALPENEDVLQPYADVRGLFGETMHFKPSEYVKEDIATYWYNEGTFFGGNEEYAASVMNDSRDPGLNVSQLHAQGITGKNVTIAIIDQSLLQDHPEYDGKILEYNVVAAADKNNASSMHGPAVTSLIAGESIGTAPGVKIYYVAMASWRGDADEGAQSLDWLIEQNKTLPEGEKIRAVSVSADFSNKDDFINTENWASAVERAELEGIMVLDCRTEYESCLFWPSYFDPANRNDITTSKIGNPSGMFLEKPKQALGTPAGYRTTAEYYTKPSYSYDAEGGRSWAIPYGVGILALGWQVNPSLSGEQLADLIRETAYIDSDDTEFLNPSAFIEAVNATL